MPHPSRRKGFGYERELVQQFREAGLRAERAWGSDGRNLITDAGERCAADVDILVEGRFQIQAKRRKAVAAFLQPGSADVVIIREDHGASVAIVPLRTLIKLLTRS